MLLSSWLGRIAHRIRRRSSQKLQGKRWTPQVSDLRTVERLEDRTLLTTIIVDTTDDVVAADGNISLREALEAANTDNAVNEAPAGNGADEILFAPALEGQTITLNGTELLIDDSVTISGEVTIDANEQSRIFNIQGFGAPNAVSRAAGTVDLEHLTLINGNADQGGAVGLFGVTVFFNGVDFSNNQAETGGAVFADAFSSVNVFDSTFNQNTATVTGAGTADSGAIALLSSSAEINESRFDGNSAVGDQNNGRGGAIYQGGGGGSFLDVLASTFSNNSASILQASGKGGALWVDQEWSVENSTFDNNQAIGPEGDGGAIWNVGDGFIINATLSGNSADRDGGAIYSGVAQQHFLNVLHATITDNLANADFGLFGDGGGIFHDDNGLVTLDNTIVAGNERGSNQGPIGPNDLSGTFGSSSFNIIGTGDGSFGINDGVDGNQVGTDLALIDPLLGPLADNGGSTQTHALSPGSPALDAAGFTDETEIDQRGVRRDARFDGEDTISLFDIGAYELAIDFGDLPEPFMGNPSNYPTTLANDGARHTIVLGGPTLGANVDGDADGQPHPMALGDDMDTIFPRPVDIPFPPGDEDGVNHFTTLVTNAASTNAAAVDVTVSGSDGLLNAWIDFNQNGVFEVAEQIFTDESVAVGTQTLSFTVPAGAMPGGTFARYRIDSAGGLAPSGAADDGEVEDYMIQFLDGDQPDTPIVVDVPEGGPCVIRRVNGQIVIEIPGGQIIQSIPDDGSLVINGSDENSDTLTIEGDAIPEGGITFNGGED